MMTDTKRTPDDALADGPPPPVEVGWTRDEFAAYLDYLAEMDFINQSPDVDPALKTVQDPRLPFKIWPRTLTNVAQAMIVRDSDSLGDVFIKITASDTEIVVEG